MTTKATRVDRTLIKYKSQWEEQYAWLLEARRKAGEISWYAYECIRFRIAEGALYTPDFIVVTADGTMEVHEVKGRWREAAMVRWKIMKEGYPLVMKLVVKKAGQFIVTDE